MSWIFGFSISGEMNQQACLTVQCGWVLELTQLQNAVREQNGLTLPREIAEVIAEIVGFDLALGK